MPGSWTDSAHTSHDYARAGALCHKPLLSCNMVTEMAMQAALLPSRSACVGRPSWADACCFADWFCSFMKFTMF